jgi:hypothetical protein
LLGHAFDGGAGLRVNDAGAGVSAINRRIWASGLSRPAMV